MRALAVECRESDAILLPKTTLIDATLRSGLFELRTSSETIVAHGGRARR